MTTRIKAGIAAVTGLMVLGAAAAPASAGQYLGPDVAVHYADLDITTAAGAEALYERIQQAAVSVCPPADSRSLARYMTVIRCRNEVVAGAVSSVSSPQVTAIYAARARHGAHSPA
jgi:UrcA family protein